MEANTVRRYSKQRDCILQLLAGTKTHPTANWIYDNVRKEIPNISLGTVYRNLSQLSESGEIRRLDVGDGVDRFDADIHPHCHMYCHGCKRLMDLDIPYDATLNRLAEETYGAVVKWHNLIFYGSCPNCKTNEK